MPAMEDTMAQSYPRRDVVTGLAGLVAAGCLSTGSMVETTTCVFDRGWIGSIKRPFVPINARDQIVEPVERAQGDEAA